LSKAHNGRVEERKAKEFDIITMIKNDPSRIDELYHRSPNSMIQKSNEQTNENKIKSGGFN
jgi:hypothetical protein